MNAATAPARPRPRPAHFRWVWLTVITSLLICGAVYGLNASQENSNANAARVVRDFRQARVDLAQGLVHTLLGGDEESPWRRSDGLLLLRQAHDEFERALALLPVLQTNERAFSDALRRFAANLPQSANEPLAYPQQVELRAEFHRLDAMASEIDAESRQAFMHAAALQKRIFIIVLVVSVALLSLITLGVIGATRREAAAEVARERADHEAEESRNRFRKIFEASPAATYVARFSDDSVLDANAAFCEFFGVGREQVIGRSMADLNGGGWVDHAQRADFIERVREKQAVRDIEVQIRLPNGELRDTLVSAEAIDFYDQPCRLGIISDITERKRYEDRIEYLATHDGLTGLPNRRLFVDRVTQAIAFARRNGAQVGVGFANLDRFQRINDGFGHAVGDELLKVVAARLRANLRESDTVARHGSDEFLFLLTDLRSAADALTVSQKLTEGLSSPVMLADQPTRPVASMGMSLYPTDGDDAHTLIAKAEAAMRRAKEAAVGSLQLYTEGLTEATQRRVALETALHQALARGQLSLVYQPKIELASGRVAGCEALMRWKHPEFGAVSPSEFIPIAEESGLIGPLGEWALHEACAQARAWQQAGAAPIVMSVNLSARQFRRDDLADSVRNALQKSGLAPEYLELELTESTLLQDVGQATATVNRLKTAGVRFSIDDFGTGYSSLAYLKRFRMDVLKIDRSFVSGMLENSDDATIVRTVVTLAHNMRMHVVAEGVETEAQAAFLRTLDCDQVQGYYFSHPVPPADLFSQLAA